MEQRAELLRTTRLALREAQRAYLDALANVRDLSEQIGELEKELARLKDALRPLATTYTCTAGSINLGSYEVDMCVCTPLNVLDCHVDDAAAGCSGSCQESADDVRSFQLMNSARLRLEQNFIAINTDLRDITERHTLLQQLLGGLDTEELSAQIQMFATSLGFLKRERQATRRALQAIYLALSTVPTATTQCAASVVNPASGHVLECKCVDPSEPCRPDPQRQACEQQCPAPDPTTGCLLRHDPLRAGQPGADAEGNYCEGVCTESLTSTCVAYGEVGAIEGCQCQAEDVTLPDDSTSSDDVSIAVTRYCIPEQVEGDFVFSCGCHDACRVLRDASKAGQTAEGYDYEGLYCSGELRQ